MRQAGPLVRRRWQETPPGELTGQREEVSPRGEENSRKKRQSPPPIAGVVKRDGLTQILSQNQSDWSWSEWN